MPSFSYSSSKRSCISRMFILQCRLQNNLTKFYREYPSEILAGIVLNLSTNLERTDVSQWKPTIALVLRDWRCSGWGFGARQVWSLGLPRHRGLDGEDGAAAADSAAGSWTHLKACPLPCLAVEAGWRPEDPLVASACGCRRSHGSQADAASPVRG